MGQSLKDTTSTMQTKTSTTMTSQTLSAFQEPHIKWNIETREAQEQGLKSISSTLKESAHSQMNGINQKQEGNGQEIMQNDLYSKKEQKFLAECVEPCLNQKSQLLQCAAKSASGSEQINSCENGTQENDKVPVYDLMIEGEHEFFANGVLVHNCLDATAYIAHLAEVVYAKPQEAQDYEVIDQIVGF